MSEIERAEAALWAAVSRIYAPGQTPTAAAAAAAVEALGAYREAVESLAVAPFVARLRTADAEWAREGMRDAA